MSAPDAPAKFIVPGAKVWYKSSRGHAFAAIVASAPRQLGGPDSTWVVRLEGLGDEYRRFAKTDRRAVPAAACDALMARAQGSDAELILDLAAALGLSCELTESQILRAALERLKAQP